MVNPFNEPNTDILKEAFPLIDISVIDDTLLSTKGDVNQAFEMLLAISDPTQSASNGPLLPSRPSNNTYAELSSAPGVTRVTTATTPTMNPLPNPFLTNNNINAKPLTVREELAQWRQDLREESRKKANNSTSRNSSASAPNLALSSMFKLNSSRPSLNDRNNYSRENHHNGHHASTIGSRSNYQQPLILSRSIGGGSSRFQHSISTPNINYQAHSRSIGFSVTQASSSSSRPSQPPPPTPDRRQSNNSLNYSIGSGTNPFLAPSNNVNNYAAMDRRSVPNIPLPPRNLNHRESSENDTPSFNPFEEPEVAPPAYNEIHRDSVVNLAP